MLTCELQLISCAMGLRTTGSKRELVDAIMKEAGSSDAVTVDQIWYMFRTWDKAGRLLVDGEAFRSRKLASSALLKAD